MRHLPKLLLALALASTASACSPAYLLRASWEEAKILARRKPIARIVADPRTDEATRGKLVVVQEARLFARDSLGLEAGNSYTLFTRVKSDTLAMVLSAAHKDRFQAHTWWFPIVGRVPYKGFFDPRDAAREAERLEREGFDTYVRPTAAFSTLGWFNDPLLSTLLRYDEVSLGNTVIHEITHNTFFAPGQVAFNESFASFVGGRGAVHFFCAREGAASARCREAAASWEDDVIFGRFLDGLVRELETLYARTDLTREAKLREREGVFNRARQRFTAEVQPRFKAGSFAGFTRGPLNNATLISRRIYYDRLELFDRVYRSRGGDLRRAVTDIIAAARSNRADPYAAVAALAP
ncbi:MAG: PUTATIVE ZINC PROTEASE PROTEIN [uncultured Gemmatimonadetes bacterium]|uniref:PUTATIVE ZINC PROTEASE PROTEIN n=1 Tax=uncultured Gemmatimonadota bacterium TaxID=203437 RepID=A0A6J4LJL2_9BACT|nr:MAG: PUTATIVE ZINC PROTEASE PROTEIN [uncultured Gemmatimonadota bacterium]